MQQCTSFSQTEKVVWIRAILFLLALASLSNLRAQSLPDLSAFQWKNQADIAGQINAESSRISDYTAASGLAQEEKTIYLAYGYFLDDLSVRIQAGTAPAEAIPAAFARLEKNLPVSKTFAGANLLYISEELIARLVENLTSPPALEEYDPK